MVKPRVLFTTLAALGMIDYGVLESVEVSDTRVVDMARHPGCYHGCTVRVEGELVHGTLVRSADCEYRFVMEQDGHAISVIHPACVIPDTFEDDGARMTVRVEGVLQPDGTLRADRLVPLRPCNCYRR
jgi:cytochrome c-type biogenesis protein CcmE